MKTLIPVLISALCCCCSAWAAQDNDVEMKDGNAVLRLAEAALNQKPDTLERSKAFFFEGYVRGYTYGAPRSSVRIPDDVTLHQEVEAIHKWLKEHPDQLSKDGRVLIAKSLQEIFPAKAP